MHILVEIKRVHNNQLTWSSLRKTTEYALTLLKMWVLTQTLVII